MLWYYLYLQVGDNIKHSLVWYKYEKIDKPVSNAFFPSEDIKFYFFKCSSNYEQWLLRSSENEIRIFNIYTFFHNVFFFFFFFFQK